MVLALGTVIGALLLFVVLRRADLGEVAAVLRSIEPRRLLLPLALVAVAQFIRPARWWIIFPPAVRPGYWACFVVIAVSALANFLLPGRGGDVLRWLLISRQPPRPGKSLTLATLGVEKLFDLAALLLIVGASAAFVQAPAWLAGLLGVGSLLLLVALLGMILLRHRASWLVGVVESIAMVTRMSVLRRILPDLIGKLEEALAAIASPPVMARVGLLTGLVWVAEAAGIWALAWAAAIPLHPALALVVAAVLNLGMMIPAAPGFVGTYEFFAVASLGLAGVGVEQALALALLMHGWAFAVATARGSLCALVGGVHLGGLWRGEPGV